MLVFRLALSLYQPIHQRLPVIVDHPARGIIKSLMREFFVFNLVETDRCYWIDNRGNTTTANNNNTRISAVIATLLFSFTFNIDNGLKDKSGVREWRATLSH
jgi:hypothetical protein